MDARIKANERIGVLLAALDGTLTDAQAEELAAIDRDIIKLAFLATAKRVAEQNAKINELQAKLGGPPKIDPATPSGQRPIYTKPLVPKRKGKPGAKPGHAPAAAGRGARTVVRADRLRREGLGRAARRRDRLADERQDLVAMVLCQQGLVLLSA